jgi:Tfp pilus assembly protein PilE
VKAEETPCLPPARRISTGFALGDLLLALAVAATLMAIGVTNYSRIRGAISADEQAARMIQLAADTQRHWQNARSYSTLSAQALGNLDLVGAPMRVSQGVLYDQWGNAMQVSGGERTFGLTVGGALFPFAADDCATIANRLAAVATNINVGPTATLGWGPEAGKVSGGFPFKDHAQILQSNLANACSQIGAVVAAEFS